MIGKEMTRSGLRYLQCQHKPEEHACKYSRHGSHLDGHLDDAVDFEELETSDGEALFILRGPVRRGA